MAWNRLHATGRRDPARGKLRDASRTQRLRKTTDRSSVLGMAAAALALEAEGDQGRAAAPQSSATLQPPLDDW